MDDSSENEDIVFVPMTTPNAEQEKSIPPNASNDVVLEISRPSGRHRKPPDYNAMNKGLDSKRETGARRKVLPNLASSLSAASISGNPAPPSSVSASTFLPSVASSSDAITNVNISIKTIQRKTPKSNYVWFMSYSTC